MRKIFVLISSHKKIISLFLSVIISSMVIQQGLFYRWFNYETIPAPITDEFNYVWQGLSLRKHSLPLGWVTFSDIYRNPKYNSKQGNLAGFEIEIDGKKIDKNQFLTDRKPLIAIAEIDFVKGTEHMFFVAPFFDHPPLGGLIYSLGVDQTVARVDQVKANSFRKPALVLAVITAIFLFIFLFLITDNPWIAALGVVIYSTVPTYLLATRTAFLENVVAPISLAQLILLFLAIKKKPSYLLLILSGLFAGFGVLAKEPAASFILASLILLLINKIPPKNIFIFLFTALLPVIGYLGWGLWLQKDLFLDILFANANRGYFGAIKLVTMLETLKFKYFPTDGWWVWGFISFLLISFKPRQKNLFFLTIPLSLHLLLILLLGSPNYPWYLISSIPFLVACSAILTWQIIKSPTVATAMAFFFIPFSSSYYWGRIALNLQPSINHYRYAFLVYTLLLAIRLKFPKLNLIKTFWLIFFVVLIKKIIVFNQVFMPYLMAHWGNLPVPNLPNF